MRKKKYQQNNYFFSDKLKRQLDQIPQHSLTIVEAPSGFGKTTAVREYLHENLPHGASEYWYTCLGEPVSIAWLGICELFSKVNAKVAEDLKNLKSPTRDMLFYLSAYLRDINCQKETYLVVDNYQLVNSDVPRELLDIFSLHGSPSLHMIFITQQLGAKQQLSIHNNNIYTINASAFFFDREGTESLFRMDGIRLSEDELENIYRNTGGWVSAIRLQLINFKETGTFDLTADIEHLVENAIWKRLTPEERDFLLSVSVLDSFNDRQAAIMLGQEILPENMKDLIRSNDFIRYLPDKHLYSIHSILQDYLQSLFCHRQSADYQRRIFHTAGQAYAAISQYYQAAEFFYKVKDFDAILSMPFSREYLDSQKEKYQPEFIEALINECPEGTLCKYPFTMLVFGYMTLMCGQRDTYQKLCRLLDLVVHAGAGSDTGEHRKIHGEYILLSSLGEFNDICKMQEKQREAWEIMKEPSELIKSNTPWLFASASILNMFWRNSGELENVLQQMYEGKYLYRQLSKGHGAGACDVMMAEAMLMQGRDSEAEIFCHKALYDARSYQQTGICLCAELILSRIAILRGDSEGYFTAIKNIRGYAEENSNLYVLRLVEHCISIISLVIGVNDNVASWLYDIENIKRSLYAPVVPFAQLLYLKLLLMEKRYNEFYGITQLIADISNDSTGNIQYMMPQVYHLIYLAIGSYSRGNHLEAQKHLRQALKIALPDKIYLPFAQELSALHTLLEAEKISNADKEGINAIIAVGRRQQKGVEIIRKAILSDKSPLTPREREVALLARDRLSAKEVAEKLYISEATVRTILRSVYSKLDVHSKTELNSKYLDKKL